MNRASSQIATKLNSNVDEIKNVIIWGNHSDTQVPDLEFATINENGKTKNVKDCVDEKWVSGEFVPTVKFRGKAIIDARGSSSALSAANAVKDCVRDWIFGTPKGEYVSMGVWSEGEYGIAKGIFYSFPCICVNGNYQIITNLKPNDNIKSLMKATEKELLEEKHEALS